MISMKNLSALNIVMCTINYDKKNSFHDTIIKSISRYNHLLPVKDKFIKPELNIEEVRNAKYIITDSEVSNTSDIDILKYIIDSTDKRIIIVQSDTVVLDLPNHFKTFKDFKLIGNDEEINLVIVDRFAEYMEDEDFAYMAFKIFELYDDGTGYDISEQLVTYNYDGSYDLSDFSKMLMCFITTLHLVPNMHLFDNYSTEQVLNNTYQKAYNTSLDNIDFLLQKIYKDKKYGRKIEEFIDDHYGYIYEYVNNHSKVKFE